MSEQPANGAPRQQVSLPPLMAQVPAQMNVLELERADGIKQVVLLINSANGTFGFPLDPEPAQQIGKALQEAGARCENQILTPVPVLLGPGGAPISFPASPN